MEILYSLLLYSSILLEFYLILKCIELISSESVSIQPIKQSIIKISELKRYKVILSAVGI